MIETIYHGKPSSGCLADYHQLAAKVHSGTHRFVNIYSPPRCGSTTVLKNSYQQIHHFHKALNEPAAQLSAGDDKESAMYRYLLNKLLSLEGEQIGNSGTLTQPFNILVKQISRHIAPGEEADRWNSLVDQHVVLLRNPILSLESHIAAALRISMQAEEQKAIDVKSMVIPGADLSHLRDPASDTMFGNRSIWQQHVDHMINTRDYSSLGDGFRRIFTAFPTMNSVPMQKQVWRRFAEVAERKGQLSRLEEEAQKSGYTSWNAIVDAYAGIDMQNFDVLPSILQEAFRFNRTGWEAHQQHTENLRNRNLPYVVVDFSSIQFNPTDYYQALLTWLGFPENQRNNSVRSCFERGFEGEDYLAEIYFAKALQESQIRPSIKSPIGPNKFPKFLHQHLSQALAIYVEILNDGHKLEFAGHHANFLLGHNENGMSILDIDPIFVYAHIATSKELIKQEKQKLLQNIIEASIRNSNHPDYCSYFTAINNAANPPFALEIDALAGGAARWRFMQKPAEAERMGRGRAQTETVAMTDVVSNEAVMAVAG